MKAAALATCGFCGVDFIVTVEGEAVALAIVSGQPLVLDHPVFCSDECERASATRLDEQVNHEVRA